MSSQRCCFENSYRERLKTIVFNCVPILLIISVIVRTLWILHILTIEHFGWGYTEFLINYEGGFVRRGLLGQFLYEFCTHTGWSPFPIILVFSFAIYIAVVAFFFWKFKRNHLCWWILLSPLLFNMPWYIVRKDYLCYAALIIAMYLLKRYNGSKLSMLCAVLVACLVLFIHEAFIFWGVPIIALLLFAYSKSRIVPKLYTALFLLIFGILCVYKGNGEIVSSINQSWNAILSIPLPETNGNSIGAIGWETLDAIKIHVRSNFISPYFGWGTIYMQLIFWVMVYYFVINFSAVFMNAEKRDKDFFRTSLSSVYLFISVCLLPMFVGLSCDYSRLYQYAIVSSYLILLMIPRDKVRDLFPRWYTMFIIKFNNLLNGTVIPTKGLMIIILIFLSPSDSSFLLHNYMKHSVFFVDFYFIPGWLYDYLSQLF